ncbi:MAG TPA: shikimate dehydrogenase, partial [Actinomycetota bacterium]|nr:shikimate dehydrogenase [Actinomycetota bacterium]
AIHGAAFRRSGLDWIYLGWPVPPERLSDAILGLRALGAMGANVTIPHKETVVPLIDELSGDARAVGAVNTIQVVGDKMIGHNTDVDGFREFVVGDAGVTIGGCSILVLGAGGAARAVVAAAADLGAHEIVVASRRAEQGHDVIRLVPTGAARSEAWDRVDELVAEADVVVNATPLADPVPGATWKSGQVAIDLVYHPPITPFMEGARRDGALAWGGLGMLIRQAAASFRIWTGQDPPLGVMSAAALHAIGSSGSTRPPPLPT